MISAGAESGAANLIFRIKQKSGTTKVNIERKNKTRDKGVLFHFHLLFNLFLMPT